MTQVHGEQEADTALQFVQEDLDKVPFAIVLCTGPQMLFFFLLEWCDCGYQVFCYSFRDLTTNSIAWQIVSSSRYSPADLRLRTIKFESHCQFLRSILGHQGQRYHFQCTTLSDSRLTPSSHLDLSAWHASPQCTTAFQCFGSSWYLGRTNSELLACGCSLFLGLQTCLTLNSGFLAKMAPSDYLSSHIK